MHSNISFDQPNIIIETVKKPENLDNLIVRPYEAWRMKTNAVLAVGLEIKSAWEVSLIEAMEHEIVHWDNQIP